MHNELYQHKDAGGKASRDDRRHPKTCKDSTETLAVIPAPLDSGCADGGDANPSNSRDERVGRRDVG